MSPKTDCFCLPFVIGFRWFNNERKGTVNLGAMHFTSLHALIKAVTSAGHTKESSYLHTYAKNTHEQKCMHTHTFDSIIIEPTSLESGSQEHRVYTSFDVSLGFLISSNTAQFRKEILGCPSHIGRIIWHRWMAIIGFHRFLHVIQYSHFISISTNGCTAL